MQKKIGLLIALCASFYILSAQKEAFVRLDTTIENNNEKIYIEVDQQPIFPKGKDGLISFYQNNTDYKICAQSDGCKSVIYNIVVDTTGTVKRYSLIKGINEKYNAETERIVSLMPKWKPGIKNEKPVKVLVTLEIFYRIDEL